MSDLAGRVTAAFELAQGGYPGAELQFMCDTVEQVRPDFIAEFGTGSGCSGRIFWECSRLLGLNAEIHTTELPDELAGFDGQHPGVNTGMYLPPGVTTHRGDGVTESLIAWKRRQPERPLFFLDGDHSEVMVYREIALIDRLVSFPVMLIHDTNGGPGDAGRKWAAETLGEWTEIKDRAGIGLLRTRLSK